MSHVLNQLIQFFTNIGKNPADETQTRNLQKVDTHTTQSLKPQLSSFAILDTDSEEITSIFLNLRQIVPRLLKTCLLNFKNYQTIEQYP